MFGGYGSTTPRVLIPDMVGSVEVLFEVGGVANMNFLHLRFPTFQYTKDIRFGTVLQKFKIIPGPAVFHVFKADKSLMASQCKIEEKEKSDTVKFQ